MCTFNLDRGVTETMAEGELGFSTGGVEPPVANEATL